MSKKLDMSYISTLEKGYSVKIVRFGVRREFYSHLLGKTQALASAIAYRNQMYLVHGIGPRSTTKPNVRIKSRRSNGTLSGVSLGIESPYAYFVTRVYNGSKWEKYRFSIGIYGYEKAHRLAVIKRITTSELTLDPSEVLLYRPTMDEYVKLIQDFSDIPAPVPG